MLLVLSIDLVDHAQGGAAPDRKAELFGNLAGDGSYYGLEPVDLPARHPVVRLGRALALDEQELTVAQAAPQPARGDRLLPLIAANPLCGRGRLIPPDGVKERVGLLLDQDHAAVDGLQKRFLDHVVKEVQQAIVKSLRVKERAGLGVAAELPPGPGPRRSLPKCRCRRAQRALRFQMVEVAVP